MLFNFRRNDREFLIYLRRSYIAPSMKGIRQPFVNTGIGILASALELALALELASLLHMYNEACKTDQGGYVTALYAIYLHCTANAFVQSNLSTSA